MTDGSHIRPAPGEPEAYCPACGQSFPPEVVRCPHDRAMLVRLGAKTDPLIGRVFDQRYEIRSRLGEGGMGAVYRGWQLSVDREVAIKVIDPKLSGNRDVVKRFLREARLSSRLGQPTIVNVYDFGQTEDGILYIVMELLRGHTLATELAARGVFSVERTIAIGIQLCDALEAAHKLDIIHRDLKPGNVVIFDDPPGRDLVKVLDFGLAKSLVHEAVSQVTHSDAMLGTPLYMSPEQIQGHPSDRRTDLYSLGCMLHEMLSGTTPFGGKTVDRVLSNHLYELAAPLPPDLPPALAELILRLIAKHPDERPGSAGEVRAALTAQIGAGAPAVVARSRETDAVRPRRRRRLVFGVVGALVALAGGVALLRRDRAAQTPVVVPRDGAAIDAGVPAAVIAVDAATPIAIDAAVRHPPDDARPVRARVDAGRPITRPPERSAIDAGELEFYRIDAAP